MQYGDGISILPLRLTQTEICFSVKGKLEADFVALRVAQHVREASSGKNIMSFFQVENPRDCPECDEDHQSFFKFMFTEKVPLSIISSMSNMELPGLEGKLDIESFKINTIFV